jgi:hypothetical protein
MIDSVLNLPILFQILVVNAILIICCVFIYLVTKSGFRFSGRNFKVNFGFEKKQEKLNHKNCENKYEVINYFKRIREIEHEIFKINYVYKIKKQMDYAESIIKIVISIFLKKYVLLLKTEGINDPVKNDSYFSYRTILNIVEIKLRSKLRSFVQENNFIHKQDEEFNNYIQLKTNELILLFKETLNDLYYYTNDIPRSKLYEGNEMILFEIKNQIFEFFISCKSILLEIKNRIEILESEVQLIFSKFI